MDGYPITPGYVINIVKEKTKPAIILLNPTDNVSTLVVTIPKTVHPKDSRKTAFKQKSLLKPVLSTTSKKAVQQHSIPTNLDPKVPDSSNIVEINSSLSSCDSELDVATEQNIIDTNKKSLEVSDEDIVFFDDAAYEEVVADETKVTENLNPVHENKESTEYANCDVCNSLFSNRSEARQHLKSQHNIDFEGMGQFGFLHSIIIFYFRPFFQM